MSDEEFDDEFSPPDIDELDKRLLLSSNKFQSLTDELSDTINNEKERQSRLIGRGARLQRQHEEHEIVKDDRISHLGLYVDEVRQKQDVIDGLLQRKESAESELRQKQESIQQYKEAIEKFSDVETMTKNMDKSVSFFRDRLGLSFKRLSGDRLQVIMSMIDKLEPERPYFFTLKISDRGIYSVFDFQPALKSDVIDVLLEKLNETNSLRTFVINIRKQFKATCTSS